MAKKLELERMRAKLTAVREARLMRLGWIVDLEQRLPSYQTDVVALVHHVLQLIEDPTGGCDCVQHMDVPLVPELHAAHRDQNARVRRLLQQHGLMPMLEYRLTFGLAEPPESQFGRLWVRKLGFTPEFCRAVLNGFCGPKPTWC
ncbi:MAG: hypothetical protein A3J09_00595 [Candidatus Zambryskibacteria bacterium RIFCSPLOWO2_02_FULL_51_21]|uniref:Uncharacterized protein n=1 Tax=Candidatus Zambryskibacteria bacterium RIFCSPHIGHO2_02_FULL_43_37 TaxID=1802749 RepID=A0A1G2THM7_9BACT|nr:MAG: hypothetical protein A2723_00595 [Candidatus Zambryskibacteria bacterium RIFCSPHIGHO2_01_FULL_52_18]OHA96703.1 MAG: hypothetical protein A3D49_02555 [Candidatus Zambryskibacteria bacterium RIFCSPHIGHO2_02_FULL_43_37]OHB06725.1 MAG: hypothetical protein A2944_02685 [Candidatus Zambryskibacteria bacterium RIFCSPLOWO2_01_FULL_52_12]OHB11059.1 MAG: hypothetical protein A3J09_00595 [Candidatus Zambryskibacteria bacterium RIFCSPLOWO2_02_FULL_51_21]